MDKLCTILVGMVGQRKNPSRTTCIWDDTEVNVTEIRFKGLFRLLKLEFGANGGLLWMRYWTSVFHKGQYISRACERQQSFSDWPRTQYWKYDKSDDQRNKIYWIQISVNIHRIYQVCSAPNCPAKDMLHSHTPHWLINFLLQIYHHVNTFPLTFL